MQEINNKTKTINKKPNENIHNNIKNMKKEIKDMNCETDKCKCKQHESDHEENHSCGCKSNNNEYLVMAQRVQADFENYKRRNENISSISFQNGVISAVDKLLPALDSFKQAKSNIKDESVLEGLELIYFQILKALNDMGVKKIECVGKPFNPNIHNAVMVEENANFPSGSIVEEFQEGFMINDKVIRHSVVKINK